MLKLLCICILGELHLSSWALALSSVPVALRHCAVQLAFKILATLHTKPSDKCESKCQLLDHKPLVYSSEDFLVDTLHEGGTLCLDLDFKLQTKGCQGQSTYLMVLKPM